MPRLHVRTTDSKQIWASPDGQRKIYDLRLEYNGKLVKAKTYSHSIAAINWEGEVDLYEKDGRNGLETFVKQPPKNTDGAEVGSKPASQGQAFKGKDEKAIQAMWAIGQAVQTVSRLPFDEKQALDEYMSIIETHAQSLYAMVPRVKASENTGISVEDIERVFNDETAG